jgi:hypothetical protein
MNKDEIIEKVYYDEAGYGSINETLKDAKLFNKDITYADVKKWKESNVERKRKMSGMNSFIAHEAHEEYQMDLMFFADLKEKYNGGLLLVDIFSKYTTVVPVHGKTSDEVLDALIAGLQKMHGKPKVIYSDNEAAFSSVAMKAYFRDNHIKHIITLGHAPVAERQIRTIKDMIYKRVENNGAGWVDVLYQVLLTYNHKMIHTVTHMTPNDARKSGNNMVVKANLEMRRINTRKYPPIEVGDTVKTFKKKGMMDKERVSNWGPTIYTVEYITESMGQQFYKLEGKDRQVQRNELLLID